MPSALAASGTRPWWRISTALMQSRSNRALASRSVAPISTGLRGRPVNPGQQMLQLNDRAVDGVEEGLEQRLQLGAVAVPWQRHHHLQNRPAEALDRELPRRTHRAYDMHGQQRDVLATPAQRRHVDADLRELLVQVAPQAAIRQRGLRAESSVAMGCTSSSTTMRLPLTSTASRSRSRRASRACTRAGASTRLRSSSVPPCAR